MKEQISITVAGRIGSGKSRMAVLLGEFLTAIGFDVELHLNDGNIEETLKSNLMSSISQMSEKRLIQITEVNLARETEWKT